MRDEPRAPRRHLGAAGRGAVSCASVAESLPALASGETDIGRRVRNHVAVCLRCQAEVARYRRMGRNLRAMRDQPVDPGPTLVGEILAAIDARAEMADGRGSRVARQIAAVGGISVATVAGAGMLVWLSRRRPAIAG